MPKFDGIFGHRFNWTFGRSRYLSKGEPESKQETSRDSQPAESDKREASDQNESNYKRVAKYNCVTEPFRETLRLIDELL